MSTSSEPSQEQSFQNGCLRVHIARVIFVPKIYTVENFREFNFRCRLDQRKYFNTELFPIYGNGSSCDCARGKNGFATCQAGTLVMLLSSVNKPVTHEGP